MATASLSLPPGCPTVRRIAGGVALFLALLLAVLTAGCQGNAGLGSHHPTGWVGVHPGQALAGVGQCTLCHEMNLLRVGSGIPNCLSSACHHGSVTGYAQPDQHGARAKLWPDASGGGLASCQLCHGLDFQGGRAQVACTSCHGVPAPHPARPWATEGGVDHCTTAPASAPVCAQCHRAGSALNPAGFPATPAPAGTAPGCFNNTLCHGTEVAPHARGAVWTDATSPAFHGLQARQDLVRCQYCHGTPGTTSFAGGAAPTSCSACHTGAGAHSTRWAPAPAPFPGYVPSHRTALNQDRACPVCHDYTRGRSAPAPAAPSCYSARYNGAGCHANGPGQPDHPVPFLAAGHTAAVQADFDGHCSDCHAQTGVSPASTAPLCSTCHQAASPLVSGACASCHEKPPAGAAFPDLAGAHARHDTLAGVTGACAACHSGFDSGSLAHYARANARPGRDNLRLPPGATAFLAAYRAKTAPPAYSAATGTCSGISCHGGIATPVWATGLLDVTTDAGCRQCHQVGTGIGQPEANSPYSGLHAFHLGATVNALCTDCHAMGNGSPGALNHFAFLATPLMEGPASDTLAPLGAPGNYTKTGQTCTLTCHNQVHTAFSWTGGANHPVPFLAPAHTAVTQAGFSGTCSGCHAVQGASPRAAAPLCTVCHVAASPLATLQCASCHGRPPAGAAFPDLAGKHARHTALPGSACATCHSGFDAGSQAHYDHANARPGRNALNVPPAPTGFPAVFNGAGAAAAFVPASASCASVSCHGAVATPSWATGSINGAVDAGCRQCHLVGTALGVPQANSPYSGQHRGHLGGEINALCTDCHTMTGASAGAVNHYAHLDTPQMEGPAGTTVTPGGSAANWNPAARTCTLTCHGETHQNRPW